jgi:holin-like protein
MLQALTVLLLFQLAGEALVQFVVLPIPGPVVGLALLFAVMALRPGLAERLREPASALLQHLSLLFVPAGVGVMLHARRVVDEWPAIVAALVLGTAITLMVTALTIRLCTRRNRSRPGDVR